MLVAAIFFFLALVLLIGLFALKYFELRSGRVLAPALRARTDARALRLKELLGAARADFSRIPPEALRLSRLVAHEALLAAASIARQAERQAYRLADLVSHKHRFEKRETRSEFLRKVAEHKNGNGELPGGAGLPEHDQEL